MKLKNLFLIVILQLAVPTMIFAQISDKINAGKEDYPAIIPRTLLVELIEEDPEEMADLQKKIDKAKKQEKKDEAIKEKDDYLAYIKSYNALIKPTVEKYWKFNKNIEFKKTSEIKAISPLERGKYVVLFIRVQGDNGIHGLRTSLSVPFLYYDRMERSLFANKTTSLADYKIYLPSSGPNSEYTAGDIIFAIRAMQANMEYNSKNEKKKNFESFAKVMAKQNCGRIKSKTLLIDNNIKHDNLDEEKVKNACNSNVKFVTAEEVSKAASAEDEKYAIVLSIPFGIVKAGSAVQVSRLAYVKTIMDAKTGDILGFMEPGMGQFYDFPLRPSNLNELCGCDK
ncbi:MAG: hypothetical protein J7604_09180 [Sporocytophaga sp.]|uniref:hypothetical protein n=1 Tax=Sporocytophaga sp. TaxID=2231183 RepID=UPI001B00A082|nr:hypothetical protein [Sporocytophaga sp.]MBO9700367.1 hypothetical protein [Sporocytophaga sp.]